MKHTSLFDQIDGPEMEKMFLPMATLIQQNQRVDDSPPVIPVCSQEIIEEKPVQQPATEESKDSSPPEQKIEEEKAPARESTSSPKQETA